MASSRQNKTKAKSSSRTASSNDAKKSSSKSSSAKQAGATPKAAKAPATKSSTAKTATKKLASEKTATKKPAKKPTKPSKATAKASVTKTTKVSKATTKKPAKVAAKAAPKPSRSKPPAPKSSSGARPPATPAAKSKPKMKVPPAARSSKAALGKPAPAARSSAGRIAAEQAPAEVAPAPAKPKKPPAKRERAKREMQPGMGEPVTLQRSSHERSPLREPPRVPPTLVSLETPVTKELTIEERAESIDKRLAAQSDDFRNRYQESLDMSWIYHDSALEGVVYTFEELHTALGGEPIPLADSSLQPTYEDIRRHKEAIEYVRDFATKKRLPVTVDVIKKIYLILKPSEGDLKTVKYRRDIPQHRLYFHEYAQPDKITYKVRQVVDWLNDPETRKTRDSLRMAARAHYDLLRVFPFPTESGKVARLFLNLLLLRTGLPPAIIHSTERQRYYDGIKGAANTVLAMVQEAVENALSSVEKLLDEHETKKRAFIN